MAVFTNDETGYVLSVHGTTLTSGNNIIPNLSAPTSSQPGKSQFGMNLVSNSVPLVGSNPQGSGSGLPSAGYNINNRYKFTSGDRVAESTLPTEPNLYAVSYIANTNPDQAPGVYSTTLTYIATATF